MRTKTLLLSAAAMVAGLVSSQAQNVYSANVVGYMNYNLTTGFNLVAPQQLDLDGTGTNNNVFVTFGTNLPAGTLVFAWSPSAGTFNNASFINSKGTLKWTGDTNDVDIALSKGQGVFIQSPSAAAFTAVGNVIQGTNVTALSTGFNLVSSVAPISGGIQTSLGYTPSVGDIVFVWDPVAQTYSQTYSFINSKGTLKWSPSEPSLNPGQAVFLQTSTGTGWTNTFTVQ